MANSPFASSINDLHSQALIGVGLQLQQEEARPRLPFPVHFEQTVRQKLRYDRCYIRRAGSLALDLKIMAATVALMLGAGPRKPTPVNALPKPRPLARKEALSKP